MWHENRKEAGGGGEGAGRKATGRGWTGRWKREMGGQQQQSERMPQ